MNLTIGFITLFMVLVLPGLIFRRFYFLGEFSKQVSSTESIFRVLIYAIIPSVIINISCLFTFDSLVAEVDLGEVIDLHKKLLSPIFQFKNDTSTPLMELIFGMFMWYTLMVYLISFLSGLFSYLLVRRLGLDKKWKLLRFKNQWAYTFNAEILIFDKFKNNSNPLEKTDWKFMFPYVDVLIKNDQGHSNLYSGFLIDYELRPENINELDRIYLSETTRFKEGERKAIPGDIFIIMGSQIKNINVNYIYSNEEFEKSRIQKDKHRNLYSNTLVVVFLLTLPFFFTNIETLSAIPFYSSFFSLSWGMRLFIWYLFTISYSTFFPFTKSEGLPTEYYFIGWPTFFMRLLILTIIYAISIALIWWLF